MDKFKIYEKYFTIKNIEIYECIWHESIYDIANLVLGNAFKTYECCKEALDKKLFEAKWKQLSIESGENENSWNSNNEHYYIIYNYITKMIEINCTKNFKFCGVYFPTIKSIADAIKDIGVDNIKKYILEVKD